MHSASPIQKLSNHSALFNTTALPNCHGIFRFSRDGYKQLIKSIIALILKTEKDKDFFHQVDILFWR